MTYGPMGRQRSRFFRQGKVAGINAGIPAERRPTIPARLTLVTTMSRPKWWRARAVRSVHVTFAGGRNE